MWVVYVDDTVFASANLDDFEPEITCLGISTTVQWHAFALYNEGAVSDFLTTNIKKIDDNDFYLLNQAWLMKFLLSQSWMTVMLVKHQLQLINYMRTRMDCAYNAFVGMLMYFVRNTCPYIAYTVHQAACFMYCACPSYDARVKRILWYLKKAQAEGLILKLWLDK
jgi:hypothetical protein